MMFATMRAAMVATMLVSASAFYTGGLIPKGRVGYFIYGASLTKLKVSQNERIQAAFDHAMANYPDYEHVYIPSGGAPGELNEARYMEEKLAELYSAKGPLTEYLPKPLVEFFEFDFLSQAKFTIEDKAGFTVDNVLKALPIINNLELDYLCLVTSDFHMLRASGIYDQFVNYGLCKYEIEEGNYVSAKHEGDECLFDGFPYAEVCDDDFLNESFTGLRAFCEGCGRSHATRRKEIKCPLRDIKNAEIFCHYINQAKENGGEIQMDDSKIQDYFRLNKKTAKYNAGKTDAELQKLQKDFFKGFKANVALFVKNTQRRRLLRRLRA